jgi:hypothetical protein
VQDSYVLIGGEAMATDSFKCIYLYDVKNNELKKIEVEGVQEEGEEEEKKEITCAVWINDGTNALTTNSQDTIFWSIRNK